MSPEQRADCLRLLDLAGIVGEDAKTSLDLVELRLSDPSLILPVLLRELGVHGLSSLFGLDAGRAALVLARNYS